MKQGLAVKTNRRSDILDAAAKFFNEKGYVATSMRDIAEEARVKTASLYYHFPSKAELLVAVYEESASRLCEKVISSIEGVQDAWERLKVASIAHLESMLEGSDFVQLVFSDIPAGVDPDLRARLAAQRDIYEGVFRNIIAELPIRSGISEKYFLLTLLGAMAWSRVWYRPGGDSPAEIAQRILDIVRFGSNLDKAGRPGSEVT